MVIGKYFAKRNELKMFGAGIQASRHHWIVEQKEGGEKWGSDETPIENK